MYASGKLNPAETRYSTIERECLTIVWATKRMHVDPNTQYTSKWINMIEDTLTGLGHIWLLDGSLHNTECIKDRLQLRLNDIFKHEWLAATCSNRVCTNYTIFK